MIRMLPTDGFHLLLLDIAFMAALYFALLFLWIYPDAEPRGLRPKDYAIMGFMLMVFLNVLGLLVLIIIYVDDRKKPPYKYMRQSAKWQVHQKGFF